MRRRRGFKRSYRRTGFRSRRRAYRRPMTSRRVRNIAARKKSDTIFGATAAVSTATGIASLVPGNNYFFHNATFRVQQQDVDNDHTRAASDVYMVGVKDRVTLSATFPYTHRRVCFWSHEQFAVGQPFRFDDDINETQYQRRNLTRYTPAANAQLFEFLFRGTLDTDYSEDTRPITPLDSRRLRIVYDKTYQVNPHIGISDTAASFGGKITSRRFWHPMHATVYYDEDEDGATIAPTTPGYVSRSPNCPGNFYILDIFSTGQDIESPDGTIGTFKPETTTYWHEA